jgi:hypothetical protein
MTFWTDSKDLDALRIQEYFFFMFNEDVDSGSLSSVFPKTLEILHEKRISYLQEQFGKTVAEQLMLPPSADTSRWFPVFLKFQGVRPEVLEVAEFEYLRHSVKTIDMGGVHTDTGQLTLNPSLQFVELHHEQPKLNRSPGLYCFFKNQESFLEFKLGIAQALIVDLLQEERKYRFDQLVQMAMTHQLGATKTSQAWEKIIDEMLHLGILITREENEL